MHVSCPDLQRDAHESWRVWSDQYQTPMQECSPASRWCCGDDVADLPSHSLMMWWAHHLRPDSTVWPLYTCSIWPWSGMPKVPLYGMGYNWLMTATERARAARAIVLATRVADKRTVMATATKRAMATKMRLGGAGGGNDRPLCATQRWWDHDHNHDNHNYNSGRCWTQQSTAGMSWGASSWINMTTVRMTDYKAIINNWCGGWGEYNLIIGTNYDAFY